MEITKSQFIKNFKEDHFEDDKEIEYETYDPIRDNSLPFKIERFDG